MTGKTLTPPKPATHVEIKYWSPKGIPFTSEDEEMVLNAIRTIRNESRGDREYSATVATVAFDLVNTGDENKDHSENFLNIAKVCSTAYVEGMDDSNVRHILCLRERFPIQALSALHDVYVCSGSPIDVVVRSKTNQEAPKGFKVGINTVMMPVVKDGNIIRWTPIY